MSRLGKQPINIPEGTQAKLENNFLIVKGPKGELKQKLHDIVKLDIDDKKIKINVEKADDRKEKAFLGLFYSLVKNMVIGVNEGFEKKLEINGVGYKVSLSGNKLVLNVGFSHPVNYVLPEGIGARVEANVITITGADKQLVGEVSAQVRKIKKPEPYKGKGIKYVDEIIKRKEGKTATKGA